MTALDLQFPSLHWFNDRRKENELAPLPPERYTELKALYDERKRLALKNKGLIFPEDMGGL